MDRGCPTPAGWGLTSSQNRESTLIKLKIIDIPGREASKKFYSRASVFEFGWSAF